MTMQHIPSFHNVNVLHYPFSKILRRLQRQQDTGNSIHALRCQANWGIMYSHSLFTPPTQTRQDSLVLSCLQLCSHRRYRRQNCLVLSVSAVWTQVQTKQDSFVLSRPSFDEFCQFPICNCSVSNILRITKNLEIGNWIETRQNCLALLQLSVASIFGDLKLSIFTKQLYAKCTKCYSNCLSDCVAVCLSLSVYHT